MLIFCLRPWRWWAQLRSVATPYRNRRPRIQAWGRLAAFTIACVVLLDPGAGAPAAPRPRTIVALGDSLTAGYGLPTAAAFPARLEQALTRRGYAVHIVNAGVSGDTVADGGARLDWSIAEGTDAVIVELGANDALRGLDPAVTRAGLQTILQRLRDQHIAILLAGMRAPPNLGADYAWRFDPIFPELAAQFDAALYPFFLEGVAGKPELNQPDGMHPNSAGVEVIVAGILPVVEGLLKRLP